MDSITDYFEQAEFALAAYSNLNSDLSFDDYVLALRDDGKSFSFSQATTFADTYRVVDQYNDPNSGLSAAIFRHADDVSNTNSFLAIRGTEPSDINDLFAGLSIALIGDTTKLQP